MTSAEPSVLQSQYYAKTAADYDDQHVFPGDEHSIALEYIGSFARVVDATTVLDVGAGTGRAARLLQKISPSLVVTGIEPVRELRDVGIEQGVNLLPGDGTDIPFEDSSFDMVICTGVLHHVANPDEVVAEMCRVARRGICISDANRFGQGSVQGRIAKLGISAVGLWPLLMKVRTRGRGYMQSEGDGVFYSYSVFDSFGMLNHWGDRTFVIPTQGKAHRLTGSLLSSPSALLVSLREPSNDWAGKE